MKITFDHRIFINQQYGGISRLFTDFYSYSIKYHELNIKFLLLIHFNKYLKNTSNKYFFLKYHNSKIFFYLSKFINKCYEVLSLLLFPPDIFHMTYYGKIPLHKKSTKVVVTVYDMIHELYPEQFSNKSRKIKKHCVCSADLIIAISENTKHDLIKIYNIDPSKIKVVYLGFKSLNMSKNSISPKLSILQKPYILFVGQRSGYKNFISLIMAYKSSEYLKKNYNIISFGGNAFTNDELKLINRYNLNNKIHHLEGNDNMLVNCYQKASVFIYPSKYEGFGIPPLEAMSCGIPVCCSNVSSIPEVVDDAAVYFNPYNINEIANALEKVLISQSLKNELIFKGKKRLNHFTWKTSVDNTLAAYKSII